MDRFILVIALTGLTMLLSTGSLWAQASVDMRASLAADLGTDPPRTCAAARVRTHTRIAHPYVQRTSTQSQTPDPRAQRQRRPAQSVRSQQPARSKPDSLSRRGEK
ncbi:MAG: hypothetical protein D6722_26970 [Bacteroidetes bacterium]|nr:MAG: hypothetical protein D6722_26970 [Bacteroidota bacterium]